MQKSSEDFDLSELLGEDDEMATMGEEFATVGEELAGYLRQGMRSGKISAQAARAALRSANPRASRELPGNININFMRPMGLYVASVATLAVVDVTSKPQREFRPERILINDGADANATVAGSIPPAWVWQINDISCGTTSQLMNKTPLNADAYTKTGFGVRLLMTTVDPAIDFILTVKNNDSAAHPFLGQVLGKAAAPA